MVQILALDVTGTPRRWISIEDAVVYHAKEAVQFEIGEKMFEFRGGTQKNGEQSSISTAPIIAVKSPDFVPRKHRQVVLSNRTLFGRDQHMCAYCGKEFDLSTKLSRDHIIPRSKGGDDVWMNVVTACKKCNCKKDDRTPEQANMPLLYVPYVPVHAEDLILQNRRILYSQMEFLKNLLPKHSRVRC